MNLVLNLCLLASGSCFNTGNNDQSVSDILNKPECQIAHQSLLSTLALVSKSLFQRIYKFITGFDGLMFVQFNKTAAVTAAVTESQYDSIRYIQASLHSRKDWNE